MSKSRHPLFQLVTFLFFSHILTSAYISKDLKFSQAPPPEVEEDLGETETHEVTIKYVGAEAEQDLEYERKIKCDQCKKIFADNNKLVGHMRDVHSDRLRQKGLLFVYRDFQ